MRKGITSLASFLSQAVDDGVSPDLAEVVTALAAASLTIAQDIRKSNWMEADTSLGTVNIQGEVQKPLDVIASDRMMAALQPLAHVSFAVSEEVDEAVSLNTAGRYAVIFDPLDGSSNVDVNITVGSIFSVVEASTLDQILQPGRQQRFAAYAAYGPSTLFTLTLGNGVAVFGADHRGQYRLISQGHRVPAQNPEYAINASRKMDWPPGIAAFVSDCDLGETGPLARKHNMRWVGSMVAELHRILLRGGLFLYPGKSIDGPGKLRLLYEANPMSFILEAAGGVCSTGTQPILDVIPHGLHQRVGVLMGSASEMESLMSYIQANPGR
ncbi:class 1 fructose-bisphosphatase [Rhizobium mongolense]|uniref:Fructose-1,6-bisphosphatase class 1 n=2 Tax=Rhizobium mongolense TaxID=57676 RepID=A0ABR6IT17_9HYPH|nr:class 1 fructose-bisphosphatase [Rhizobium mongolense]MBB4231044.1 fructose-1,6-bisphosphatase I [Rhizobium mongolense]TVZ66194.1 fructose-1,6-bisphosphatase I [Rhizobium mongolense USDA 1844]